MILEGEVERVALDESGANAYEAKYRLRPEPDSRDGLWYAVRPRIAFAWLESDYPRTATRFAFD